MRTIALLFVFIAFLCGCSKAPEFYGKEPFVKTPALTVSQALEPTNFHQSIVVRATVQSVCKTEGCWTILTDGKQSMRVVFAQGRFASPMDTKGKTAIVEGQIEPTIVSEEDARIYAEQAGLDAQKVTAINGEQRIPIFTAESLRFE
ncbi:MAG TPA: DUF4920 domain-containing protein [Candidatus Kapabacteria bacterium]|jgi:uncharacterized protein YceK|nr:DUF4920 domain-containing protein [Candidatus Kapabacteria bacterium]HRI30151.1 DUF4920 domain-containing protein [Candidatus Kapabacteria bacterium]HRK58401.1 DUF4920 domain-containing protein [Candidatus Kapabacteria bacterium]